MNAFAVTEQLVQKKFVLSETKMRKSRKVEDLHEERFRNRAMALIEDDDDENFPSSSSMSLFLKAR